MAVFLSPGVFTKEIDLSVLPAGTGALTPSFVGTAKKGPVNVPTLVTSAGQFIEIFGEPFPESYLGYAVLRYMEEGNRCFVLRTAVESKEGQSSDLDDDTIDLSGAQVDGWGRIPVFTGIDYGKINLRAVTSDDPVVIAAAGVSNASYTDSDPDDGTDGGTNASINFSAGTYDGSVDDIYTMLITGAPTGTGPVGGATFQITTSDGTVVKSGTLSDTDIDSTSSAVTIDGMTFTISVTAGELAENDVFVWRAQPDTTKFKLTVDGTLIGSGFITVAANTYNTVDDFVSALNTAIGTGEDAVAVKVTNDDGVEVAAFHTTDAGKWIQLTDTEAFATEVGISKWTLDIPRSFIMGTEDGPFAITSSNNRVILEVKTDSATTEFDFTIPNSTTTSAIQLASVINANGVPSTGGSAYFKSFVITIPGGDSRVVIMTAATQQLAQLILSADFSHLSTLRFADEIGINFPYTRPYRGFNDPRVTLPVGSSGSPVTCDITGTEHDAAQCELDSAYYESIVGFLVAKTAGTWIEDYSVSVGLYSDGFSGNSGRYQITVYDSVGNPIDSVTDISFDPSNDRYISKVVNDGGSIAGVNGNQFYQWEERTVATTVVRNPSAIDRDVFIGGANGIPSEPQFSSLLDGAIIGNPATATGLYSLQNPESFDFNILVIPGFTSGPVVAAGLQFAEGRGDVLYLVDPPFGLRPQQVVDWHNGMLSTSGALSAAINSSYGALYWSWVKVSDQFNGGTIWIPPSGHLASVFARTARDAEQWFAPAGLTRGRLLTALDLEYNPTLGERDALYGSGNAVNPLVDFTGEGIVVWGQRTLQRKASALDRVNVRMLLIFLKKNLERLLRNFVFEPNDDVLRSQVTNTVNPFLADILARRGITAYKVVCDESNNTPERRDRNELWVSVFIQPTRTAEFVVLNLVVLRTGASFGAQEVLAAGGVVTG